MPTGGHLAHAQHFAGQRSGACTYLTAWAEGQPVGSCLIHWEGGYAPEVRQAVPDAVEVSNLHVHPDAQGRGIGTALLRSAEDQVVARGGGVITLGVGADNPRAASLYARLGYRDIGLRRTARYVYRGEDGVDRQVTEDSRTLAKRVGTR